MENLTKFVSPTLNLLIGCARVFSFVGLSACPVNFFLQSFGICVFGVMYPSEYLDIIDFSLWRFFELIMANLWVIGIEQETHAM